MRIIEVEYSKLVSEPLEFGNKKVGAKALVAENEHPQMILSELKAWVDEQLQVREQMKWKDKEKIAIEVLTKKFPGLDIPF